MKNKLLSIYKEIFIMDLQNGYKVLYEVAADGMRTFYASKSGTFADAEPIGDAFEIGKYKLVYEKNGKIYCSETGVPKFDENGEPTDFVAEGFSQVFVDSNGAVNTPSYASVHPEVNEHPAYAEAISTNGDSHGKLTIEDRIVTLNATNKIKPATNPNGNTYHHVGFKITAPEGIDPANVVITRPDSKTRVMANILDGTNFTNMYWKLTEDDRVFTYYIDWNNDGVNDLTVTINATKATLVSAPEAK
jgi:hypothetical protein